MNKPQTTLVASLEEDGVVIVHARAIEAPNDYAALCGLDIGEGGVTPDKAPIPKRAKINCAQCFGIWLNCQRFTSGNFESRQFKSGKQP